MYKALFISGVCAACALGQNAPKFGPIGITTALAGPMANVSGAPYSAQSTTSRVQVLADGNRIVQTTSGMVARDTQGRVRREETLPGLRRGNGDAPQIVMIDDPVAQVHWTLDARSKTAMKMQLPSIKSGPFGVVAGSGMSPGQNIFFTSTGGSLGTAVFSSPNVSKNGASSEAPNVNKTDLGAQTIEGVPAQGTRVTQIFPAGEFGNEQPMTITTETWYSPDLKVLVMSKSSDPRMGDTTYTLTNIQRSEPPANLFQVPEDYTVKEAPVPTVQVQKNQ